MNKSEIRKLYLQKRQALSADKVLLLSEKIAENFLSHFKPAAGQKVHVYFPIEKFKEINTSPLIEELWKKQIKVYVPKVVVAKMKSVEITPKTVFKKNTWGILEPVAPSANAHNFDIVIAPLLYCDHHGNRVGYGKGFYDDFFTSLSNNCLKIGFNYFAPNEEIDDLRKGDIPLDYLVTPTEVLSFGLTSKSTK